MTNITLSSSAVLVDLNISVWTGRKMDKKVSAEIDYAKGTSVRAGNYNKELMAGASELAAVNKYAALLRNWHAKRTLPWSDSGTRIISTAQLFDYKADLAIKEGEFQTLVRGFMDQYDTLVQAAQFRLGSLFDADEYPPSDVVESKFGIRYVFSPVPEAGDFRVDIGAQGLDELRRQYETNQNRYVQQAMADMWERVRTVTERLSNQLRVTDNDKGKLYQSTLDGALELCSMMDSMNLTGDIEMDKVRKSLYMTLNGIDMKELKKDDAARAAVKQELDDLISKFSF